MSKTQLLETAAPKSAHGSNIGTHLESKAHAQETNGRILAKTIELCDFLPVPKNNPSVHDKPNNTSKTNRSPTRDGQLGDRATAWFRFNVLRQLYETDLKHQVENRPSATDELNVGPCHGPLLFPARSQGQSQDTNKDGDNAAQKQTTSSRAAKPLKRPEAQTTSCQVAQLSTDAVADPNRDASPATLKKSMETDRPDKAPAAILGSIGESACSEAHPVTGEPMVERPRMSTRSKLFRLGDEHPLQMLRAKLKRPAAKTKNRKDLADEVENIDGIHILKSMSAQASDLQIFCKLIDEWLDQLIYAIPFEGSEKENGTIHELNMVATDDNGILSCVVIRCASSKRKADVAKRIAQPDFKSRNHHGLSYRVIHDPDIQALAVRTASNSEQLHAYEQDYYATTALIKDTVANVWDSYIGAPLYISSESDKSRTAPKPLYHARCTLGGFLKIGDGTYGLTVAHPLLNSLAGIYLPTETPEGSTFSIGKVLACVLSSSSSEDDSSSIRTPATPRNSDWALIELNKIFTMPSLKASQNAINLSAVAEDKLEVLDDTDLRLRQVHIQAGFSGGVRGKLNIARSSLRIAGARFNAMPIYLDEALGK